MWCEAPPSPQKKTQVDVDYRTELHGQQLAVDILQGGRCADAAGVPARVTGTVMDITARARPAEPNRQALIFESIYDGVVITDLGGGIIDWNASGVMFGRNKSEAMGRRCSACSTRTSPTG